MYLMLFRQLLIVAILTTQKSADKSIVSVGDTITYTTTITNTGNTAAKRILLSQAS